MGLTEAQRESLREQITVAVDRGDTRALSALIVDFSEGTELLTESMSVVAAGAGERMVDEASAQGVAIEPTEPDRTDLAAAASAVTSMLAQQYAVAAGREALRVFTPGRTGAQVAAEVDTFLAEQSTRALVDELGGTLWGAENLGRYTTLVNADPPAVYYVANEVRDKNTCKPCKEIDGTLFSDLDEAREAYPDGGYKDCLGRSRCRGTYEPSWTDMPGERGPDVPKEARPYHRDLRGIDDLAAAVKAQQRAEQLGEAKYRRLASGSGNEVLLGELADGRRVIRKSYPDWGAPSDAIHQADAEQLGAIVARALDVQVPRVYRESDKMIWQEFVRGKTIAEIMDDRRLYGMDVPVPREFMDTGAAKRIGLLDALISGMDRNQGNWMVDDLGDIVAIDHGATWGAAGADKDTIARLGGPNGLGAIENRPAQWFAEMRTDENGNRSGHWIPNPLTKADVAEVRRRLKLLRPDFVHLDREDWLDYTLETLKAIAENAAGAEGEDLYG